MSKVDEPLKMPASEETVDEFDVLSSKSVKSPELVATLPSAVTARFYGFDFDDRPLVVELPDRSDELVVARTTVHLSPEQIGSSVLLVFEAGDVGRPIIIGVLQTSHSALEVAPAQKPFSVDADGERCVISAEREIVLRCGDASITLTRAGKVIIKGSYIVSRSSGYNKIKGAAVDIN